jgi:hypothetical protein
MFFIIMPFIEVPLRLPGRHQVVVWIGYMRRCAPVFEEAVKIVTRNEIDPVRQSARLCEPNKRDLQ